MAPSSRFRSGGSSFSKSRASSARWVFPAVRDRVGQEVLRRLLAPIFEPLFHNASCGFRKTRNCHLALELVLKFHEAGYRVVLDADIKGFLDLPLAIIMEAVAAQVADGNILRLIEKFLRCGVMENGVFKPTTIGTPQGDVIQPHRGDAGHTRRVAGGGGGCIGGPQPGGFARGRELRRGAGVWHPPAVRVAAVRALGAGTSREVDDGRARRTGGTGEVSDHTKLDWPSRLDSRDGALCAATARGSGELRRRLGAIPARIGLAAAGGSRADALPVVVESVLAELGKQNRTDKRRDGSDHDVLLVEVRNLGMQDMVHQGIKVGDEKDDRNEERSLSGRVPADSDQPVAVTQVH